MSASKSQSDQLYPDKKPYVFGSSTPREFSYMNNVPAEYRIYDAKFRRSRRTRDEMTLSDYLRKIRSTSPSKRRDRSVDSARIYVFGSSTPRNWSFMDKIPVEYRIYDTSLNVHRRHKRSKTTSFIPTDYSANQTKPMYGLKSYSSLGMSQSGQGSEIANNRHKSAENSKKSERNRSVPPSSSSSRHNGPPSVDSQRSSKSGRSTSSHHRIAPPNKINVNYDRNSPNQGLTEKNSSTITTPNEELVLIVTETVSNLETPSVLNGNHDETVSIDHDDVHNAAYSSYIEKQVNHVQNSQTAQIVNGQKATVVEAIETHNVPHGTIIETNNLPHGTNNQSESPAKHKITDHESDIGDNNSESDVESNRSSTAFRQVSAIRKSFDVPNDAHDELQTHNKMARSHENDEVMASIITPKVVEHDHQNVHDYDRSDHDDHHEDGHDHSHSFEDDDRHNIKNMPNFDSPKRNLPPNEFGNRSDEEKHEGLVN